MLIFFSRFQAYSVWRLKVLWRIISWMENRLIVFYRKHFGKSFKFHLNLDYKNSVLNYFPFTTSKFLQIESLLSASPIVTSCILNQFLWYNRYIKIDNDVFFKKFSEKGVNCPMQLFHENWVIKNGAYWRTSLTLKVICIFDIQY